jgi:hypothetical protein
VKGKEDIGLFCYTVSNVGFIVDAKPERIWKKERVGCFKAVFQRLILGTEKTTENHSEDTPSPFQDSKL